MKATHFVVQLREACICEDRWSGGWEKTVGGKIDRVEVFHGGSKYCYSGGASFHCCNRTRVEGDCAT